MSQSSKVQIYTTHLNQKHFITPLHYPRYMDIKALLIHISDLTSRDEFHPRMTFFSSRDDFILVLKTGMKSSREEHFSAPNHVNTYR